MPSELTSRSAPGDPKRSAGADTDPSPATVVPLAAGRDARPIRWNEWGAAAFARARAEQKPMLLAVVTSWSASSIAMDRSTYSDPDIAATIDASFVPIRVDADRRPDIDDRYNLGGWPTTAFLTPEGEVLSGGTFMPPEEMSSALERVAGAFGTRRSEIDTRAAEVEARRRHARSIGGPSRPVDRRAVEWLTRSLVDQFDRDHGGFGSGPKFPHAPALALLLERCRESADAPCRQALETTLDHMAGGPLYDCLDGGFFRCASRRDWSAPQPEKLLGDQAALLALYLEASSILDRPEYRDIALGVLRYVHTTLADQVDGGFFGSERAPVPGSPGGEEPAPGVAPFVDRTLFVGCNAEMCAAYLRAADELGDSSLRDFALTSLERIVLAAYRPGGGVAHYCEVGHAWVRGLLADQVHVASALVAAYVAVEQLPHVMLAEELMQYAVRTMWDESSGGFFDRVPATGPGEYGRLRDRRKPISVNCEAVRVLLRLAALTGKEEYRVRALDALRSQTETYREHPLTGAPYGLAILDLLASESSRE